MRPFAVVGLLLVGCTGEITGGGAPLPGDDDPGTPAGPDGGATAVPGMGAVARARQWVDAKLHYCQAPNHARDYDADCPTICEREDNPAWDPYRSDCSGFVSWAWALPAPGRITDTFAPYKTDITHAIQAADLRPGDAVNNDHHIMLFVGWNADGTATFFDEPGCSSSMPYARETTAEVTTDGEKITVQYHGAYTAIRYDAAP